MTIYLDEVFLLNLIIDYLILLTESITLKYNVKMKKIILSSLFGSFTLIVLFINLNKIELFLIKLIISIIMNIIAYSYKDIKYTLKNIIYFYFISIIYGGFLYFLINNFKYENIGLSFIKRNSDINIFSLLIISPIILYCYIKMIHNKYNIVLRRKVSVFIKNKEIKLNGYIDTGNNLKNIYDNTYVMITNNKLIKNYIDKSNYVYIPYKTIDKEGLMKTKRFKKVIIDGKLYQNISIGYIDNIIKIDGIDIILNNNMIGENYD